MKRTTQRHLQKRVRHSGIPTRTHPDFWTLAYCLHCFEQIGAYSTRAGRIALLFAHKPFCPEHQPTPSP